MFFSMAGLMVVAPSVLTVGGGEGNACSVEIKPWRGYPSVWVNGEPSFPMAFLMHTGDFDKEYAQMASAGIRFYTMAASIGNTPTGFSSLECDAPFLTILRHRPDALIFPRVDVTAPPWWLEEHPDERVIYDDGTAGPQSMFSEVWLKEACDWIEQYSRYIRNSDYAEHVVGIHICSGYTGEWQSWGLWDGLRGDWSPAALRAWRQYLRDKYQTSEELSKAWGSEIDFDRATIPDRTKRERAEKSLLRDAPDYQDVFDFYDFYWRGTVRAIGELARAAKRGGGKDWLVGFFYGYGIQYGGKAQESQHLGMHMLARNSDIDFFCSPGMYTVREPGGTSSFMSYTDSLQRRGKLWWHEADNRTHLSVDNPVAPAQDLFESLHVLKREFAHAWCRHTGIWWFDMQGGWYDDPAILGLFREMVSFSKTPPVAWEPKTEIAVFYDEKSMYRLRSEEPLMNRTVTEFMAQMPRLGAPYHTYLLEDISSCQEYKVYIFTNAFDLTREELEVIRNLTNKPVTLIFMGSAPSRVVVQKPYYGILSPVEDFLEGKTGNGEYTLRRARILTFGGKAPDVDELRGIVRESGVFLFHDQSDALYVGNGVLAIHGASHTREAKHVRFPESMTISEILSDEPFEGTGTEIELNVRPRETRCFVITPGSSVR